MRAHNYVRVQQLLDLGRNEEARDLATTSLREDPHDPQMLSALADATYNLSGPTQALVIIDRALALEPEYPSALAQRGYFLSQQGRHAEAEEAFNQAIAIDPRHVYALTAQVEAVLRDPKTNKRRHKEQRLAFAQSRVLALLTDYPDLAVAHLMDAKVKLARGNNVECDIAARRALVIEPDNSVGHQLVGLAAEAMGNTQHAGDAYISAAKADPTSSTGLDNLRRLGKGAVAPVGFAAYIAVRLAVRAGSNVGGVGAVLLIGATVVTVVGFFVLRRRAARTGAYANLSTEARSILDQDKKMR